MSSATLPNSQPGAAPRVGAATPLRPRSRLLMAIAYTGAVVLTGAVAVAVLHSAIVDRPSVYAMLRFACGACLLAIASHALARDAGGRLAPLLLACAYAIALGGLTAVDSPLPFAIGRIATVASLLLMVHLSLSFPRGWLEDDVDAGFMAIAVVGSVVLLGASLLVSRYPPVAGPFVRCSGPTCPANPLAVFPLGAGPSRAVSTAFGLWTTATVAAMAVLVARRARHATRLQRRSLAPVQAWSFVTAVAFAAFVAVRAIDAQSRVLGRASLAVAVLIALLPAAIALGLARGRVFAVSGLERMLAAFGDRASAFRVQRAMQHAFGDPTLRLLLRRPGADAGYVDVDGASVEVPRARVGSTVTEFGRDGEAIAAAVHDRALGEAPDVMDAAGSAILLALENARLSAELRVSADDLEASRRRIALAADEERVRIERDIHDGAQQRLVALRIHLSLLEDQVARDPASVGAGLAAAGADVEAALEDIRTLAHGIYPPALRDLGVGVALSERTRRAQVAVTVEDELARRPAPEIETAIYFCCLEALQNVAKHCGTAADAHVRLWRSAGGDVEFSVTDDGPGFESASVRDSHGLVGMRDRLAAVGGRVTIRSSPGHGTTVAGRVPARSR